MKFLPQIVAVAALAVGGVAFGQSAPDFKKDIAPILRDHCVKCHGAEKQKGKYRMDLKADAFKGGKSGKAGIVASKSAESELLRRVGLPKDDDDAMPPEGDRVSAAGVAALKAWIEAGAQWPDDAVIEVANTTPAAGAPGATPMAPRKPRPPTPELPKDFKPGAGEAAAAAGLKKIGVNVLPLAQNVPWTEANFRLQGTNVTDKELAWVKDLPSLVELRLGNTKVTDAGLAALKSLPNLQVLSLELTSVGDAGLEQLKDLKNLVYLNLYGTQVTDAGLEHLKGQKHLRSLYVWQSKVTEAGVKKLQEALPLLEVNTGAQLVIVTNAPEKKEEKKAEKK